MVLWFFKKALLKLVLFLLFCSVFVGLLRSFRSVRLMSPLPYL